MKHYLILIALCFLVYANSLNNAFVSDDIPSIVNSPYIAQFKQLEPASLLNSLCYKIGKLNPFPYHLTNIILHCIATILVFHFLKRFFQPLASLIGAGLFAIHPVHIEAVTWISGKPYIILTIFILAVYLLYQRHYLLSLLSFTCYLIFNFSFFALVPFFIIFSDILFKKQKQWRLWLPFLAVVIIRLFLAKPVITQRIITVSRDIGSKTITNPLFNFSYSFFEHLKLLFYPAKLTLYHEPAVISSLALKIELLLLAILAISLLFVFKKAKKIIFALGIFILFLAPTYSPITISWLVAERYLYFGCIMLSIFIAVIYSSMPKLLPLLLFILMAFAVRTVARNEDWKDTGRLWRSTVMVSPYSHRAHNNMGDAYIQEGNIQGAIKEFTEAVNLKPDYADGYYNLAVIYNTIGNTEYAQKLYNKAISLNKDLAKK